jgi:hypothetical protein
VLINLSGFGKSQSELQFCTAVRQEADSLIGGVKEQAETIRASALAKLT